jgi:DNA-binding NarL/FixJ family response regulator
MKVFVSDRYPPVQERLVSIIALIADTEIVSQNDPAFSIAEAIERLGPDVALFDVRPGVMEELQQLQEMKARNHSPVIILLTDEPYLFTRTKLLKSGADFVFQRSYQFENVRKLIEEMSRGEHR